MELPDFEDLARSIDTISQLALEKSVLDITIKEMECNVFKIAITDEKYLQQGKIPSTAHIENTYRYTGLNNEILPYRLKLAKVSSELEKQRLSFELMKDKIEIWRSEQATKRISLTVL